MYYIYAYLRTDGSPYYIGKGKGKRLLQKHHKCGVPKNKKLIVVMESNLTEIGALALERFYIRWYGRKDNDTGILRNLTDGGEGTSGWTPSEETVNKIRKSKLGQKYGFQTEDHKFKRLQSFISNPHRKDKYVEVGLKNKEKLSKLWSITFPDGTTEVVKNMAEFCRKHNLHKGGLHQTVTGKLNQFQGFKAQKI